ncbi:MAG: hypothetical protein KAX65_07295 [Caldilineaceae bacterium]|nr:hypothetical protein [Caldilineaceae bacterium]
MTDYVAPDSNALYERLRMEQKLDQLIAATQTNSQQLAQIIQQQAHFDRRLSAVETGGPKPLTTSDRILFVMFAIGLLLMFAYNLIGRVL